MCDVAKLRGKIAEKRMTQFELAEKIGIDRSTLNRKMKKGESFTLGEAKRIAEELSLTRDEAISIFFNDIVA